MIRTERVTSINDSAVYQFINDGNRIVLLVEDRYAIESAINCLRSLKTPKSIVIDAAEKLYPIHETASEIDHEYLMNQRRQFEKGVHFALGLLKI